MAQTLKILIDAYTSRIVRGQSTQKDVIDVIKLLVKKDAMLDSLDARERSYDNSPNGINFTIRKVNLMFVFIVVVWIFFFNKYMIQNPVFFVHNVIMSSIAYAIVLSQATQGHVSRKSQQLIYERVTRCVTQSKLF